MLNVTVGNPFHIQWPYLDEAASRTLYIIPETNNCLMAYAIKDDFTILA